MKYKLIVRNSYGDVKYNMASGRAKELKHMVHGHEQWYGDCLREWGLWVGGGKRGKIGTTVIA